ncbi:2-amino-4-hydroxy-6-hydroxymethyldihydropteridine diphosphokinase [Aliikangiella sp. IMCC44653]
MSLQDLASTSSKDEHWKRAYIGLGANLNHPKKQLQQALIAIQAIPKTRLIKTSSFFQSDPMGPQNQPDFVNAVALIETQLTPLDLLDSLQSIEQTQGRVRKKDRWGPRTLDLDILIFEQLDINTERLTVPHYGLYERPFVLIPLHEIEPLLILPNQQSLSDRVNQIDKQGLQKL